MKRFYKLVSYEKKPDGFYAILLDGREVKTKSGALLLAQNETIATQIMSEWAAQEGEINPENMPFTQILSTRIDQVSKTRATMSAAVMKYLDTDLVCYLAETPLGLHEKQEEHWAPVRDWISTRFGSALEVTTTLQALKQPKALHSAITQHVEAMSDDVFTLFQVAVCACGSLILGLTLIEQKTTAEEVFEACFIEERFKDVLYMVDVYGRDPLNERKQRATLLDLKTCETYLSYLSEA